MKKSLLTRVSTIFIFGVLLFVTMVPAFAAYGESAVQTQTVYGYQYQFYSLIHNEVAGQVNFQTTAKLANGSTIPVGYIGTKSQLYSSEGILKHATTWAYSQGAGTVELTSSSYSATSGYYFSQGQVKLYNGSGYNYYDAYATANFAPGRTAIPDSYTTIEENAHGEIYGSKFFLNQINVEPDLILAEEVDGSIGYIRATDLDDGISTPAAATESMLNSAARYIPLYENDGTTVIGTFLISASI